MSNAGLPTFDRTLQQTHIWLNEIGAELRDTDRQHAYRALRAVLHALRDRLPVEEAAHLGAQLPMLIRGLFYEGWQPGSTPLRIRSAEAFLERMMQEYEGDDSRSPEELAAAVLQVLERHVSHGEIDEIKHILPKGVREVWPEPV